MIDAAKLREALNLPSLNAIAVERLSVSANDPMVLDEASRKSLQAHHASSETLSGPHA